MELDYGISIGSKVQWLVKPSGGKEFKAIGIVRYKKMSTFGGKKKGKGASIEVRTKKYHDVFKKKITFISLANLTLVDN